MVMKTYILIYIVPAEIKEMKDASHDVCFHKVIEHFLPRFNGPVAQEQQSILQWQAVRIRNYTKYLVIHHGYKLKYYDPCEEKKGNIYMHRGSSPSCCLILMSNDGKFYGVMMARIFSSNLSIDNMLFVLECFVSISWAKEAITQYAYKDLYQCMHLVNDWEVD